MIVGRRSLLGRRPDKGDVSLDPRGSVRSNLADCRMRLSLEMKGKENIQ